MDPILIANSLIVGTARFDGSILYGRTLGYSPMFLCKFPLNLLSAPLAFILLINLVDNKLMTHGWRNLAWQPDDIIWAYWCHDLNLCRLVNVMQYPCFRSGGESSFLHHHRTQHPTVIIIKLLTDRTRGSVMMCCLCKQWWLCMVWEIRCDKSNSVSGWNLSHTKWDK